jgi:murein DD-endopeptidase MepM/ murein hydrolase activator NlpD
MDLPGFAATNNDDGQRVEAASGGDVATEISLDSFKVSSYGMVRGWSVASGYWAYKVNKTGPIRWPFLFAAPISSGFGSRSAPCRGCQSYHTGLDFNPDGGTDIHAVADGVVIEEENLHYSYGRFVVIHHNVNGMEFDSRYAHMIPSSVHLHVGDVVKVGDYVGEVGHTGNATGDHLHLEIIIDGTPVDPFPWLKKYAK